MSSAARASILQGLVEMTGNPLRTVLSTLGIVIGVASVIATLSLTDGLERYAREQIETRSDVQSLTVSSRTVRCGMALRFRRTAFPSSALRTRRSCSSSLVRLAR